jgi:hypothetical protein
LTGGAVAAAKHFNTLFASTKSVSVWAVSVGEVNEEDLQTYEQPSKKLPAHAVIDLAAKSEDEAAIVAVALTARASKRGKLA